ncbi:hypothetical protein D3C75_1112820 [compost metagenome]
MIRLRRIESNPSHSHHITSKLLHIHVLPGNRNRVLKLGSLLLPLLFGSFQNGIQCDEIILSQALLEVGKSHFTDAGTKLGNDFCHEALRLGKFLLGNRCRSCLLLCLICSAQLNLLLVLVTIRTVAVRASSNKLPTCFIN